MAGNFTFFKSESGQGVAASDYLKDAFEDISVPANSNTGFSSVVTKNPLSDSFLNDDAPKYGIKTLWVKDLLLLEDRSQWINNKPTYRIIWNENFPGVNAYVFGNCRLRNSSNGVSAECRFVDDGAGVVSVARRVSWILNPSSNTASADIVTDGTDTGSDITFGSHTGFDVNINKYLVLNHQSSNNTKDLHDFRITANNEYTLSIAGVVVYFENAAQNIDAFPGSTYVDKSKVTTSSASSVSLPSVSGKNGANSIVQKTALGTYTLSTQEAPAQESVGVGSANTNTITVTTGHGASFPIGSGVVAVSSGSSFYVGAVTNVSTDTLTVGPTLGTIGMSGAIYKAWQAGPTYAIGATLYALDFSFDSAIANNQSDAHQFGVGYTGTFWFQDPLNRYRAWGSNLSFNGIDGIPGLQFATLGFLQFDGRFSAAEIEYAGVTGAILHATFSINGTPGYGVNEGMSNVIKRTVFTDGGPGWNSFKLSSGTSFLNLGISRVNFYKLRTPYSATLGVLGELPSSTNYADRAVGSSQFSLGTYGRIYADQLYLTGEWARGVTHGAAGGVHYRGTSTNSALSFTYYGKDFALLGSGLSGNLTIDGVSISSALNLMKSVATEGFHTVALALLGGTAFIEAADYARTKHEVKNLQKFLPREELDDSAKVYVQSDTPRNPKDGDHWVEQNANARNSVPSIWIYLSGLWHKIQVAFSVDDPHAQIFVLASGYTGDSEATATDTVFHYNLVSWSSVPGQSNPVARSHISSGQDGGYGVGHHNIGGLSVGGTAQATQYRYVKNGGWATLLDIPDANGRRSGSVSQYNSSLYYIGGVHASTTTATRYRWNGVAWATLAASAESSQYKGAFVQGGTLHYAGGHDGAGALDTHYSNNTANTESSALAVVPTSGRTSNSSNSAGDRGYVGRGQDTASYQWDGSSWSTSIVMAYTVGGASTRNGAAGYHYGARLGIVAGGSDGSSNAIATAQQFNGISFKLIPNAPSARGNPQGSCI